MSLLVTRAKALLKLLNKVGSQLGSSFCPFENKPIFVFFYFLYIALVPLFVAVFNYIRLINFS